MGLDTTHDCWHGSYSGFMAWRKLLARAAGLPKLKKMMGFGGTGKWEDLPAGDVLYELLNHSDADGEIAADLCERLADRLAELLVKVDLIATLERDDWNHMWRDKTQQFIDGLRLAASKGESIEFH